MSIYLRVYLLALLLPSFQSLSSDLVKIPMDEVDWEYKGSSLLCNLEYINPSYGKFYFRSEEREQVSFNASLTKASKNWRFGQLFSMPPPWDSRHQPRQVTDIALINNNKVSFTRNVDTLLADIGTGNWLQFSMIGSKPSAKVTYRVPTTRIHDVVEAFRECQSLLPNMTYAQARDIVLSFQSGQTSLSAKQLTTLSDLNSYLKADPNIDKILIDGYTDNVGAQVANLKLSKQRAELVAHQIEQLGVNRQSIEVRSHGSRYPIASNTTKQGQAKNRRVTIRLVRKDETVVPVNSDITHKGKG